MSRDLFLFWTKLSQSLTQFSKENNIIIKCLFYLNSQCKQFSDIDGLRFIAETYSMYRIWKQSVTVQGVSYCKSYNIWKCLPIYWSLCIPTKTLSINFFGWFKLLAVLVVNVAFQDVLEKLYGWTVWPQLPWTIIELKT